MRLSSSSTLGFQMRLLFVLGVRLPELSASSLPPLCESALPVEERATFDPVCFSNRFSTVFLPELEYGCPFLRCVGDHIAEAYASLPHKQPTLSPCQIASYSHAP